MTGDPDPNAPKPLTPEEITALQDRNRTLEDQAKLTAAENTRIDNERRAHQRRADQLKTQLEGLQQTRTYDPRNPMAALQEEQTQRRMAEMEAEKYRLLAQNHLTEEDLPEGVTYTTPAELMLHIQLAATNKVLRELNQSNATRDAEVKRLMEERENPTSGNLPQNSGGLFDTGGPSGPAADAQKKKIDKAYQTSEDLRKSGDLQQGAYVRLRAIHADPNKTIAAPAESETLPEF